MPLSLCLCPGWFLCYLFERSFWVIHWACSSYYVCFTLNHSTLLCSLGVRRCYFPLSIFSLVLPLPFFLVNNSCTLTSSCSYLSVNKKDRNSLQVLCEVWQSLLSKANDSVFKVNINFLGLRLMALALLPGWKRHKVVIKSLSHFIINNVTGAAKPVLKFLQHISLYHPPVIPLGWVVLFWHMLRVFPSQCGRRRCARIQLVRQA